MARGAIRTMEIPEIYEKLNDVFEEVFDDDISLQPELTADQVDGWDSISHIRLILSVQRRFSISFSASEIGRLKNVGEFVQLIQAKRPAPNPESHGWHA
jgi:acyl carrier protein